MFHLRLLLEALLGLRQNLLRSMLATLAQADCLIVRGPLAAPAKAGEVVEIVPLSGGVLGI